MKACESQRCTATTKTRTWLTNRITNMSCNAENSIGSVSFPWLLVLVLFWLLAPSIDLMSSSG